MSRFVASSLDLSRLPAPKVVEELNFETIVSALRGDFEARWADARIADPSLPPYDAGLLETDPATILIQAFAYREMLLRARVNDAARSVMLAYSVGSDLDQLAALFGVVRMQVKAATQTEPAVMEGDERLRRRVLLALEAFSVAGPEGAYVFHALSASVNIVDVHVFNPRDYQPSAQDGQVHIVVLSDSVNGVPSNDILLNVANTLHAAGIDGIPGYIPPSEPSAIRPLTDKVTVYPAKRKTFTVNATMRIGSGPDAVVVRAEAIAALEEYLESRRRVGRTIALSGIYDALHLPITETLNLITPTSDIVPGPYEAAFCTGITLNVEVGS